MVIIVKLGGSVLKKGLPTAFVEDLKSYLQHGRAVFLHGGADIVSATSDKMNVKPQFIVSPDGMRSRYTDRETMEVFTMVMAGKINKYLVANLLRAGVQAIGLCGADGLLLRAERKKRLVVLNDKGRKSVIDGGFTGKIIHVNVEFLSTMLNAGLLPVIAPIALDEEYELVNVDSDRAAAYIAGSLKAESLVIITNVPGLLLNNSLVRNLTVEEAHRHLSSIGHGMKKKVYAALEALNMGAKEVVISSGLIDQPITAALTHREGSRIAHE